MKGSVSYCNIRKLPSYALLDRDRFINGQIRLLSLKSEWCTFEGGWMFILLYKPRHEKTCFLHMRKQRRRPAAGQRLCFRYIDSAILLLPKSDISSL